MKSFKSPGKFDEKEIKNFFCLMFSLFLFVDLFFAFMDKNREFAILFVIVCNSLLAMSYLLFASNKSTPMYKLQCFFGYASVYKAFIYAVFVASGISVNRKMFFVTLGVLWIIIILIVIFLEFSEKRRTTKKKHVWRNSYSIIGFIFVFLQIFY